MDKIEENEPEKISKSKTVVPALWQAVSISLNDFVRFDVTKVHSSISLEIYCGL